MDFTKFSTAIHARLVILESMGQLYKVDMTKGELWSEYLNAFPPGTNEIYKERREYDCQCCAQFVKNIGGIVAIVNGRLATIWDIEVDAPFQTVCDVMASNVRNSQIENVFLHTEPKFGQEVTTQTLEDGGTINWNHFHYELPCRYANRSDCRTVLGKIATNIKVFKRGLEEITPDSLEIIFDLIKQGSLYKGDEYSAKVKAFMKLSTEYRLLDNPDKNLFLWQNIKDSSALIRSSVIGTLLTDLSEGKDLTVAVTSFESKVAPMNYKRSSALITKGMVEKALAKIDSLGIREALDRRFAVVSDISINDVLFADRSVSGAMKDNLLADLMATTVTKNQSYDGIAEIGIKDFIKDVLPNIETMEVEFKNHHVNNLVSLTAPQHEDVPHIFQWKNNFAWSYNGDITDSIKERVKRAGGAVDGVLRTSLAWYNSDDLDIQIIEPSKLMINFGAMSSRATGGRLDVDMNAGGTNSSTNPVENITYPELHTMPDGDYALRVNQYSKRRTSDVGFECEIAFNSVSQIISYPYAVKQKETVNVCIVRKTGNQFEVININPLMSAEGKSKEVWGVNTEQFQKVELVCLSPNFWGNSEQGNKHYMFMLEDCANDLHTRGIYNEFLRSDLHEHRKVMEMVGEKTKCAKTNNQISGLGFSSTQRASIICKVTGNFNRTIKINF